MTELLVHHDSWAYKHSSRNCNTVVLQFSHSVSVSLSLTSGCEVVVRTYQPSFQDSVWHWTSSVVVHCLHQFHVALLVIYHSFVWDWPHFACQHNVTENSDLVFFIVVMIVLNQLTTGHQLKKLHKPARNLPVPATTTKKRDQTRCCTWSERQKVQDHS